MDCKMLSDAALRFRKQFRVVAVAASKEDIFRRLARKIIDVVVLSADLQDNHLAGLKVLVKLRASHPSTEVIMLLDPSQNHLAVEAFCGGARGVFCRSETNLDVLRESIDAVHKGEAWTNSRQLQILLKVLRSSAPNKAFRALKKGRLTKRAHDVANLVAEGFPSQEVAQKLGISETTVSNDLLAICSKLGFPRTARVPQRDSEWPAGRTRPMSPTSRLFHSPPTGRVPEEKTRSRARSDEYASWQFGY